MAALDFQAMLKQAEIDFHDKLSNKKNDLAEFIKIENIPDKKFDSYKILNGFPESAFYVPEFLDASEATGLIKFLSKDDWVQLKDRKLKNYGGAPHLTGTILEPLPKPLQQLCEKLVKFGVFAEKPDQALVNSYESTGGIGYHNDGPNFKPKAAIISLLSPCLIHFRKITHEENKLSSLDEKTYSLLLEPNSLFVFQSDLYEIYKHGINCNSDSKEKFHKENKALEVVRKKRMSITLRNVSKIKYKMSSVNEILPSHLQEERERSLMWWKKAIDG